MNEEKGYFLPINLFTTAFAPETICCLRVGSKSQRLIISGIVTPSAREDRNSTRSAKGWTGRTRAGLPDTTFSTEESPTVIDSVMREAAPGALLRVPQNG